MGIDNYDVEEFDTEIIYDKSGIEVGETSTRLPILIPHDPSAVPHCKCQECKELS